MITQLVNKFPTFNGTTKFITVFTTAHHWSFSWARCMQSTTSHPVSLRSVLILSCHLLLGLPSSLPFRFSDQNIHAFPIPSTRATYPAYLLVSCHMNVMSWEFSKIATNVRIPNGDLVFCPWYSTCYRPPLWLFLLLSVEASRNLT